MEDGDAPFPADQFEAMSEEGGNGAAEENDAGDAAAVGARTSVSWSALSNENVVRSWISVSVDPVYNGTSNSGPTFVSGHSSSART